MAKEKPDTKPKATMPFRKFDQPAKKLVKVPKDRAREEDKRRSA